MAAIGRANVSNVRQERIVVRIGVRIWRERVYVIVADRQACRLRLAHHPFQRDVVQTDVAVAAADIGVDTSFLNVAAAAETDRKE